METFTILRMRCTILNTNTGKTIETVNDSYFLYPKKAERRMIKDSDFLLKKYEGMDIKKIRDDDYLNESEGEYVREITIRLNECDDVTIWKYAILTGYMNTNE